MRDNSPLPDEGREFLAEALEKISIGEKPSAALKLNGRMRLEDLEREKIFANAVHQGRKLGHGVDELFTLFSAKGVSVGNATFSRSRETIRDCYYKHRDELERLEKESS